MDWAAGEETSDSMCGSFPIIFKAGCKISPGLCHIGGDYTGKLFKVVNDLAVLNVVEDVCCPGDGRLGDVDHLGWQFQEDAYDVFEGSDDFFWQVFDDGGRLACLYLPNKLFGLLGIVFEIVDYLTWDVTDMAHNFVGPEKSLKDRSI